MGGQKVKAFVIQSRFEQLSILATDLIWGSKLLYAHILQEGFHQNYNHLWTDEICFSVQHTKCRVLLDGLGQHQCGAIGQTDVCQW